MMMNERVRELLEYLNALSQVQGAGHYVNEEIKEAVKEIRIELGLDKIKRNKLKDSQFLVFEGKLGRKANFEERMLFEAMFSTDEYVEILVSEWYRDSFEILKAMKPDRKIHSDTDFSAVSFYFGEEPE